jgi:iron complex outermembrane receptor protein
MTRITWPLLLLAFYFQHPVLAQNDLQDTLSEVIVTGFRDSRPDHTSLNIEPYSLHALDARSPHNLSDALSGIPGISQMTTGGAISKPVIRGLYGNRILVLLSGARFDNQQWQDEHGLGLSQIGIDRVEVIKGPASLLYGTDALGGVINVIEEKPSPASGPIWDASTRLYSNTLGTLTDIGYKHYHGQRWQRLRIGYENHGDYADGNGKRVLNSRNTGYYLKAGVGFDHEKWIQNNSYNLSFNQYGFILDDLGSFFEPDARWSRKMAGPHHNVLLNVLNSQNTFYLDRSTLKVNVGAQSNLRQEDEGGGQISLNMHLLSLLENARWEKNLRRDLLFTLNHQFTFENNTNYGGRIIIPDANLAESTLSAFLRHYRRHFIAEAGLGGNFKFIQTFETLQLNSPEKEIQPFSIHRSSANGMLGVTFLPGKEKWVLKSNVSSGFRAANLAELASNGLHEGIFRYEIGDPNLKIEQNVCADFNVEFNQKALFLSLSTYYNQFFHYIYLAPTDEEFFGFQVFRYRQQSARILGGELTAIAKPVFLPGLEWKESFVITKGQLDDGDYLPFIAPYRLVSSLRLNRKTNKKITNWFLEPEFEYVWAQEKPANFETATPAYHLLGLHAGITTVFGTKTFEWTLSGKNLLNEAYVDHLSRLKQYGLLNPGIQISFSVKTVLGR